MIATLRGEVTQIEDNAIILEVGGVGLRVFVPAPLRTQRKTGEVLLLYTHLVVREDALTLYGFESQADRELFNTLLGVDGVGPKVALSVLSTMTLDAIQRAVFADEADVLSRFRVWERRPPKRWPSISRTSSNPPTRCPGSPPCPTRMPRSWRR